MIKSLFSKNFFTFQTFVVFFYVVVGLSMLNFTLITADRLTAVKWPFFYEDRIHTKELHIAIALVWGITTEYMITMITLFNVLDPGTARYLGNVTFVVVVITGFITLFISNSFVSAKARSQLKAIKKIIHSIENISVEPGDESINKKRVSEERI